MLVLMTNLLLIFITITMTIITVFAIILLFFYWGYRRNGSYVCSHIIEQYNSYI